MTAAHVHHTVPRLACTIVNIGAGRNWKQGYYVACPNTIKTFLKEAVW